jgi:hypothetical protein
LYPWTQVWFALQKCKNKTCKITKHTRTHACTHARACHWVSPLQLVNQWVPFMKLGTSQWRPPHFTSSHDQY